MLNENNKVAVVVVLAIVKLLLLFLALGTAWGDVVGLKPIFFSILAALVWSVQFELKD